MSESKTATVKFVEDEDIYIDCKPVTTYGGEVVINDADNNLVSTAGSAEMLDSIASNFLEGNITDNIVFQTIIGITLLGVLYGVGNYVFKELPETLIESKLRKLT
jgi:hypothetical protein